MFHERYFINTLGDEISRANLAAYKPVSNIALRAPIFSF